MIAWERIAAVDLLPQVLAPPVGVVVVVDNASTNGSAEYVREHHPSVEVLMMPEPVGFVQGANARRSAGYARINAKPCRTAAASTAP